MIEDISKRSPFFRFNIQYICRVHFCIPGINAINIHMKVVNSPVEANGKKKALLEDAPSSNVYSQLQKLTAQNPVCEYFSSHNVDFRVLLRNCRAAKHAFLPSFLQSERTSLHFM